MLRKLCVERNWWPWAAGLLLLGVLAGCGEQDLYKPPRSPYVLVGRLPLPSFAEGVSILGDRAYVAGGEAGMHVVDLSDPAVPRLVETVNTDKYSSAINAAATPLATGGAKIAFTIEGTEGMNLYDVTNPAKCRYLATSANTFDAAAMCVELPEVSTDVYTVYIADNWRGLWVFRALEGAPGDIGQVGRCFTLGYAKGVAAQNGFVYVADDELGLSVADAQDPVTVQIVSNTDTDGNARGVAVTEDYAYVADGKNGLVVMRIHRGDKPVPAGHLPLAGDCKNIAIRDNYAFIAAQDGGVHIIDIRIPSDPRLAGTVFTPYATGVSVSDSGLLAVSDRIQGLLILAGPGAFRDTTPPATVGELAAEARSRTVVRLRWHAPGNDLFHGTAAAYEVRRDDHPITGATWDSAIPCAGAPAPLPANTEQTFNVVGLSPETPYYFAIKAVDGASHWSGLSNTASAVTLSANVPPELIRPSVSPRFGPVTTNFVFEVIYTDADPDAPARAEVLLNGEPHAMTATGDDWVNGVTFRYEATLAEGDYSHQFAFDDGNGHTVTTEARSGPWVGGVFLMGSPVNEQFRDVDEREHPVRFTAPFWLASREVTQAEWKAVMGAGNNPSRFVGDSRPVERVSWFDAVEYCNLRSAAENLDQVYTIDGAHVLCDFTKNGYRLPTEAEWERTCRAGTSTQLPTGDSLSIETCVNVDRLPDPALDQIAWYCGNAGTSTHDVGTKNGVPDPEDPGNPHYDMLGNVWEWCWDWYSVDGVEGDPTGPADGSQRVIRGGSWYYLARDCRPAARAPYWPNSKDDTVGFRVARTLPQ